MGPKRLAAAMTMCAAVSIAGCRGVSATNEQASRAFHSIRATADAAANGWLDRRVSSAFARVALDQAYRLAEETRTGLTGSPEAAADAHRAALADACAQLSRSIAALVVAVERDDIDAVRAAVENLPTGPS